MKSTFLALCTLSFLFLSCANERKSEKADSTASPTFEVAPTSPVDPGAINVPTTTAPPSAIPPTANVAGLNPAHGQPGHRCDIAVGAPLNSAPSPAGGITPPSGVLGAAPAPLGTAPVPLGGPRVSVPPSPGGGLTPSIGNQPVVTAPGMNPPHGQPGHDCAIAVGAPLKK